MSPPHPSPAHPSAEMAREPPRSDVGAEVNLKSPHSHSKHFSKGAIPRPPASLYVVVLRQGFAM